jgi:hypothetical protein
MTNDRLPLSGGCQCGAVHYRITGWPVTLYCCHCTECQRQASSAFGMSLRVARDDVDIDWPAMARRVRDVGRPNEVHGHFCANCGVRIVHDRPGEANVTIKAGTLDDTSWLNPVGHIWTASAQPWMRFPDGSLVYETQPERFDDLEAAWAGQGHG